MLRTPWAEIRQDYIRSLEKPSISKLASKYEMHPTSIGKKCAAEGWVKLREQYHEQVGEVLDQSHPDSTLPSALSAPANLSREQSVKILDRLISLFAIKLEPTDVEKNDNGEITKFDFDVPRPFSNVLGLARILGELITLREKMQPILPTMPLGLGGNGDGKVASLQAVIERVRIWGTRLGKDDGLLKAGERVIRDMDIKDAEIVEKKPKRTKKQSGNSKNVGSDDVDAILEALVNEANGATGSEEPDG